MSLNGEPICDLCGGRESYLWRIARGPGGKRYTLRRCDSCGLVLLHPQAARDSVLNYYSRGEGAIFHPLARDAHSQSLRDQVRTEIDRHIYFSDHAPQSKSYLVRGLGRLAASYFRYSRSYQRPPAGVGRALDVGCGDGKYLAWLRDVWGWQVYGVELSTAATRFAREVLQLDIQIGTLEDISFPAACFDLITMWDVLEHTPSPARELSEVVRVLKPGGTLRLVVPNIESWPARLFRGAWAPLSPPEHLFHFSQRTLRAYLEQAGLQVETIIPVGSPHVARSVVRWRIDDGNNGRKAAACLAWAIWPVDALLNLIHIRGGLFASAHKVSLTAGRSRESASICSVAETQLHTNQNHRPRPLQKLGRPQPQAYAVPRTTNATENAIGRGGKLRAKRLRDFKRHDTIIPILPLASLNGVPCHSLLD